MIEHESVKILVSCLALVVVVLKTLAPAILASWLRPVYSAFVYCSFQGSGSLTHARPYFDFPNLIWCHPVASRSFPFPPVVGIDVSSHGYTWPWSSCPVLQWLAVGVSPDYRGCSQHCGCLVLTKQSFWDILSKVCCLDKAIIMKQIQMRTIEA